MNKNRESKFKVKWEIRNLGNWNFRFKEKRSVCTKPIGVIKIDQDEFVFNHDDIFELIKCYHKTDKESINMILNRGIDTGTVKHPEDSLLTKLQNLINDLKNEDSGIKPSKFLDKGQMELK